MTDLAFRCPHLASLQLFHFQYCKLTLQTKNEMIKSTFKVLFYLRRDTVRKNGLMPIIARITIDGKLAQFNTKIEINPEIWSIELGRASGMSRESKQTNTLLDDIKASIHRIYHEMQRRDSVVTAEKVKNEFLGITEHHDTLLDLFRKHNDDVQKLIGISKSAATYQKYEVTRKHLQTFIESKYRLTDISLKEINHMFITDFEIYLLTAGRCSQNTTAKFMQFFKRIIIVAKNNGLIVGDPFANYKIRIKKVDRGYLSEEELGKIMKKKFSSERLENVRDIFIFSCFTGLAYIDVKNLTQENVRTSFDGNLWIMTKRQKTDTEVNVPLLKIPKMILEKYKGKLPNKKLLPILNNQIITFKGNRARSAVNS